MQLSAYCLSAPNSPFIACFAIMGMDLVNISPLPALSWRVWRDNASGGCFSSWFSVQCLPGSCSTCSFSNACLLQCSWLVLCLPSTTQMASPTLGSSVCRGQQHPAVSSVLQHPLGWLCSAVLPGRDFPTNVSSWHSIKVALWWVPRRLSDNGFSQHPRRWISGEFCWHGTSLTSLPSHKPWLCLLQQGLGRSSGVPGVGLGASSYMLYFSTRDSGCSL